MHLGFLSAKHCPKRKFKPVQEDLWRSVTSTGFHQFTHYFMQIKEKKEVSFVVTTTLFYESSFGITKLQKDVKTQVTIGMHEHWQTGWFEIYDVETGGEEFYGDGGLWFENDVLTDYDGVFSLSDLVVDGLEKYFGIDVSDFRD